MRSTVLGLSALFLLIATPVGGQTSTTTPGQPGSISAYRSDEDRVSMGRPLVIEEGEVVQSAVVMGSSLTVRGRVEEDAVVMGGTLTLAPGATVGGSAVVMGGSARVGRRAAVNEDLVGVGSSLFVDDDALIGGDVVVAGAALDVAPTARILGQRVRVGGPGFLRGLVTGGATEDQGIPFLVGLLFTVARYLVFLVLGLLILTFLPHPMARIHDTLERFIGLSGALGLVGAIAIPIILVLLVISLIGILLVPAFILVVAVAYLLGFVALAVVIGERIPLRGLRQPLTALALGVLVLFLVDLIPFVGGLLLLVASFFALGAVLYSRFGWQVPGKPIS